MRVFDASSMIYAWDNYPMRQFPPLWDWMAQQVKTKKILMPKIAFKEVDDKERECSDWLNDQCVELIEESNMIIQEAVRVKGLLEIDCDQYHPKGVGENDILIIATALVKGFELVSDEGRQKKLPKQKAKMKIPAVCGLKEVAVPCINFIELIKQSNIVFG